MAGKPSLTVKAVWSGVCEILHLLTMEKYLLATALNLLKLCFPHMVHGSSEQIFDEGSVGGAVLSLRSSLTQKIDAKKSEGILKELSLPSLQDWALAQFLNLHAQHGAWNVVPLYNHLLRNRLTLSIVDKCESPSPSKKAGERNTFKSFLDSVKQ